MCLRLGPAGSTETETRVIQTSVFVTCAVFFGVLLTTIELAKNMDLRSGKVTADPPPNPLAGVYSGSSAFDLVTDRNERSSRYLDHGEMNSLVAAIREQEEKEPASEPTETSTSSTLR